MLRSLVFHLVLVALNLAGFGALYVLFPELFASVVESGLATFREFDFRWASYYSGLLVFSLVVEALALRWRRSSLAKVFSGSKTAITDLVYALLKISSIRAVIDSLFTFGIFFLVKQLRDDADAAWSYLAILDLPALQFFAYWLLFDFLTYWHHRFMHTFEFAWQFHKLHHSATELTLMTGERNHPLQSATHAIFVAVPLALLGTPATVYIAFIMVQQIFIFFQHSSLPWTYGAVGDWLIYSPTGHRIHHSMEAEHLDTNLGNMMPLWDRLFGTWYAGELRNDEVGVADNHFNQRSFWTDIVVSFQLSMGALFRSLRTGNWRVRRTAQP